MYAVRVYRLFRGGDYLLHHSSCSLVLLPQLGSADCEIKGPILLMEELPVFRV